MNKYLLLLSLSFSLTTSLQSQQPGRLFRIRTITAGVTLKNLNDTNTLNTAVQFLNNAKQVFIAKGYEVQTLRISTQHFYKMADKQSYDRALTALSAFDRIAQRNNIVLSIGQILPPDEYQQEISGWVEKLAQTTSTISFNLSVSSPEKGIHYKSVRAAAEIITALSRFNNGEANFRFAATANCPAGIPFFPAAFHDGKNSFAVGLESPNLITEAFKKSNTENAKQNLKSLFETNLIPVQNIAEDISKKLKWQYDGIDVSPAPGLDASIGQAIETYTKQPFGSAATLSACSLITDVLKNLNIKKCGYSGLMLPVIEDLVLAKRAEEGRYSLQTLLLYSAVSGTGLDVVPIPGDTPKQVLENILIDVAALSLKYSFKALSARLFLIPGKKAGDIVSFDNPYLTRSVVLKVE
ncbi:MAG TPA: DUF711 family protein [Chitinophagaceae bacterium]